MRIARAPVAALLAWLAAGCTPMQWVKAEGTPESLEQDTVECQQEAWREARFRNWYYAPMGPFASRDGLGRSVMVWPSGRYGMGLNDTFLEEGRLAQFCMRMKGWEMVPVEEPKK